MLYRIVIEKFTALDDDNCELNELWSETTTLSRALDLLKSFALHHPNGYLLNGGGHLVEYEIEGAELSCWIDYKEEE